MSTPEAIETNPVASSLDRVSAANWKLNETNGFVIRDYTGCQKGDEPVIIVLKTSQIFDYLQDACENHKKIAVYAIGQCLLDVS